MLEQRINTSIQKKGLKKLQGIQYEIHNTYKRVKNSFLLA